MCIPAHTQLPLETYFAAAVVEYLENVNLIIDPYL